jgi:hypothetical protein
MANTISTPGALIAARTLETLLETFPVLRLITADFSPEPAKFGQTITVSIPSAMTAGDYSTSTGYPVQDVNQTTATLVINKHKATTYSFNDQERSSVDANLIERYARAAAHSVGKALVDDICALIVAANFSNSTTLATASVDRSKVVALNKTLNGRKLPVSGRFFVVNSDYYEKLANDTTVIANAGSPSDTVRSGRLGNIHGVEVVEYPQLPGNSENLAGFAGVAEGIVIASRVPTLPDQSAFVGGSVENITEPNTGLTLQVRSWYDFKLGNEYRTFTLMYGVAKGNTACVQRFVTA